jgi:undecaprenyl diphosphate synthase
MNSQHKVPECIGFIMDGNRRWASSHKMSALEGHTAGFEKFKETLDWLKDHNIANSVYYTFSTENWQRSQVEIDHLLTIFMQGLRSFEKDIHDFKVRLRFVGQRHKLPKEIQNLMIEVEKNSAHFESQTIWVAISYGGRAELIEAVNRAIVEGQPVDERSFPNMLWTAGMPDPDLIIRTGGEQRLSNFLPWQSVYSELFFIATEWPAFTKAQFVSILEEYGSRQRRLGT